MREKLLITSLSLGTLTDIATTTIGINVAKRHEMFPFLADQYIKAGKFHEYLIIYIGFTAFLIGLYSLTKKYNLPGNKGIEKGLILGNSLQWLAVAWNMLGLITWASKPG